MCKIHTLLTMTKHLHQLAARDSDFLKVLAGRTRILLLWELYEGEKSVGDVAKAINIQETAASQQLGILKAAGLVSTRREGQRIYYSLVNEDARQLLTAVREVTMKTEVGAVE